MTKVKKKCGTVPLCFCSYSGYRLKETLGTLICRKHLSDVGDEKCLVLVPFVFL